MEQSRQWHRTHRSLNVNNASSLTARRMVDDLRVVPDPSSCVLGRIDVQIASKNDGTLPSEKGGNRGPIAPTLAYGPDACQQDDLAAEVVHRHVYWKSRGKRAESSRSGLPAESSRSQPAWYRQALCAGLLSGCLARPAGHPAEVTWRPLRKPDNVLHHAYILCSSPLLCGDLVVALKLRPLAKIRELCCGGMGIPSNLSFFTAEPDIFPTPLPP